MLFLMYTQSPPPTHTQACEACTAILVTTIHCIQPKINLNSKLTSVHTTDKTITKMSKITFCFIRVGLCAL